MDVLAALADNLGTNTVHLPLAEGMLMPDALGMINNMYLPMSPLASENYADSQAYVGPDGKIKLELISKEGGNVLMTFVNMMSSVAPAPRVTLNNPFGPREYTPFLGTPLVIDLKEELDFLNDVPVGIPVPTYNVVNDVNYRLATLLNNYNYLGRWMAGTFGLLSTAGFEVVFKGWSIDAPDEFLLDYSPYVVIVKLHEGETQGFICLRTS
jgi:hypothetical protein